MVDIWNIIVGGIIGGTAAGIFGVISNKIRGRK